MRFSTFSVAAVAALTSLVANATPTPTSAEDLCVAEICYGQPAEALTAALNTDPSAKATSSFSERHLSNAERMSRGLPVNRPSRLFKEGKRANASPSVVPQTTFQGYLQVSNAETNEDIGFISKNWLSGGAYPRFQETLDEDALLIRFTLPTGAESGTNVEFQIDGFSFPYFGLIQGRDSTDSSLAAGSFNYLYLGATAQTPVSSVPVFVGNSYSTVTGLERTSESAVWTVDAVTGEVFPQWTNPDETLPVIEQFTQSTTFYFTADTAAFVARYPAPTVAVKYTFVPI